MNQTQRTLCFLGAAVAVCLLAFFTRPSSPGVRPDEELDAKLYPNFTDPLAVTSLEITRFDEETFALSPFELEQVDGLWTIASHENYPADAEDQVADAAASVIDLTIVGIASDNAGQHALYGVVEPDKDKINRGTTGVGTLVTMRDSAGDPLARIIIGKPVKDNEELHYVRKAGQDRVYTVKVDPEALSTKFGDWIEKDLLQLDVFDINKVTLNDYAIVDAQDQSGRLRKIVQERSTMQFAVDNSDWTLEELRLPGEGNRLEAVEPAPDEEPDTTTLNNMKNALDDLEIADVERKPRALAEEFKAGDEMQVPDRDSLSSLVDHGFFAQTQDDRLAIYSDAGEVIVGLDDGTEYVLHFGAISGGGETASDKSASEEDSGEQSTAEEIGLNRYILVSARFNPALVDPPEIKPLPPVEAKRPEIAAEKPVGEGSQGEEDEENSGDDQKKKQEENENDGEEATEQDKQNEEDAERKRVEEENKKAREDYVKKLADGRENVRKLNYRFADWYFVISEDVYKKIHLSKEDVLKKKDAETESTSTPGTTPTIPGLTPGN